MPRSLHLLFLRRADRRRAPTASERQTDLDGDGRETKRVEAEQVSDERMYLILNLAVGGRFRVTPDASTPFPGRFEIVSVRVWQR